MTLQANVSKSSGIMSACRMRTLGAWSRPSHLYGVVPWSDTIMLQEDLFACCGGSGIDVVDLGARNARMCGLRSRWARLSRLARNYFAAPVKVPFSSVIGLKSSDTDPIADIALKGLEKWHQLHLNALRSGARGRLVRDAGTIAPSVSDVWAIASVMAWHHDVVTFVHIHGAGNPPVADWQDEMQGRPGQRAVLFVDQVSMLWDSNRNSELEQIIQFASSFDVPLWIITASDITPPQEEPRQAASKRFGAALGQRMARHRSGPIEQWLSGQALSRLTAVCDLPASKKRKSDALTPDMV